MLASSAGDNCFKPIGIYQCQKFHLRIKNIVLEHFDRIKVCPLSENSVSFLCALSVDRMAAKEKRTVLPLWYVTHAVFTNLCLLQGWRTTRLT